MSAILFNNTSHEKSRGFVYRWTYIPTGQYYIGIRKGHPADGYLGSGKRFVAKYRLTDPNDWQREIIYDGDYNKCPSIEEELVTDDTIQDPLCLNLIPGGRGWMPLRKFSRKNQCYRVRPQEVVVDGNVYNTRLQAIKALNISFAELDTMLEKESYNQYNKC